MPASRTARSTVLAPLLPLVAALAVWAPLRHNFFWNDDFVHIATRTVREAATSAPAGATVRIENQIFLPSQFILHFTPGRLPGWAGIFVVFSPDDAVEGGPIRFLVSDDDWQRAQQRSGRIAALVDRRARVDRPG